MNFISIAICKYRHKYQYYAKSESKKLNFENDVELFMHIVRNIICSKHDTNINGICDV